MATVTVGKIYIRKMLEVLPVSGFLLMALDAIHFYMFSLEWVVCLIVIKFICRGECFSRMTLGATIRS